MPHYGVPYGGSDSSMTSPVEIVLTQGYLLQGTAAGVAEQRTNLSFLGVETTENILDLPTCDALTTGSAINVVSNSADTSARSLIFAHNDNAAAVGVCSITARQDSVAFGAYNYCGQDSSGTSTMEVWPTGHIRNDDGNRTTAAQYGPAFVSFDYGTGAPEHTDGTGSYDHTGNAAGERIFTSTAGAAFTSADAAAGNWVLLTGANLGAMLEIKRYIDGTHVEVDGMGLAGDLASQTYSIYKHPSFITGDGNLTEFSVGATGEFEIYSYAYTRGSYMAEVVLNSAADSNSALMLKVNAGGYNQNSGLHIQYTTGDIQIGDTMYLAHIALDDSLSSADATTSIGGLLLETAGASAASTDALRVAPGWTHALRVVGTASANPDYGYEVTSGTVADRVNAGGGGTADDAFINAAVDQELFDTFGDYILIGSDNTFELIQVNLAVAGSQSSGLLFYYSKAGGGWTQFFPDDTTNDFRNSGTITFNAPGDWTKDDEAEVNADITNAYYIKIQRARLGTYTLPTENFFKIFPNQTGGMDIRGDGVVKLPYLGAAPASLENGMIWMEADGLHLYYNAAEKLVAGV